MLKKKKSVAVKGRRGGSPSLRPRDVAARPTSCSACGFGAQFLGPQLRSRPVRGGPVGHQGLNSRCSPLLPSSALDPRPEGRTPRTGVERAAGLSMLVLSPWQRREIIANET